jgi:hypothetical protein
MASALPAMSPRAEALQRTFRAAWSALAEHGRAFPGEAAEIYAACAAHVRSAAPMAMLDTGPVARVSLEPVAAIERELGEGAHVRISSEGGCVVVAVTDAHDGHAVVAITAAQSVTLRSDIASVASGIGDAHG